MLILSTASYLEGGAGCQSEPAQDAPRPPLQALCNSQSVQHAAAPFCTGLERPYRAIHPTLTKDLDFFHWSIPVVLGRQTVVMPCTHLSVGP